MWRFNVLSSYIVLFYHLQYHTTLWPLPLDALVITYKTNDIFFLHLCTKGKGGSGIPGQEEIPKLLKRIQKLEEDIRKYESSFLQEDEKNFWIYFWYLVHILQSNYLNIFFQLSTSSAGLIFSILYRTWNVNLFFRNHLPLPRRCLLRGLLTDRSRRNGFAPDWSRLLWMFSYQLVPFFFCSSQYNWKRDGFRIRCVKPSDLSPRVRLDRWRVFDCMSFNTGSFQIKYRTRCCRYWSSPILITNFDHITVIMVFMWNNYFQDCQIG